MAKFKKGDRVRTTSDHKKPIGTLATITQNDSSVPNLIWDDGDEGYIGECDLKLVTDTPTYQPITPKVGEKYRVLKEFIDSHNLRIGGFYEIKTVRPGEYCETTSGFALQNLPNDRQNYLPTEYLELVEEPVRTCFGFEVVVSDEPIKQSIITKSMNFIKSALLSKEDKTLIKAGYLNDDLSLTSTGKSALEFITFTSNKKQLVTMAEEALEEKKD
jgi:hypothetical protein